MSVIGARRLLRSSRRRLALAVVLVATVSLVVLHHGVPMSMHDMPAAAVCLAVLGAGAAVASAAGTRLRTRRWLPVDPLAPVDQPTRPRSVPARAGPFYLRLAVLRR